MCATLMEHLTDTTVENLQKTLESVEEKKKPSQRLFALVLESHCVRTGERRR